MHFAEGDATEIQHQYTEYSPSLIYEAGGTATAALAGSNYSEYTSHQDV